MSPTLQYDPHEPAPGGPIFDHMVSVEEASDDAWYARCYYEGWKGEPRRTAAEAEMDARIHERGPLGDPDPNSPYNPRR